MIKFKIMDSALNYPVDIRCVSLYDAISVLCSMASRDMRVYSDEDLQELVNIELIAVSGHHKAKITMFDSDLSQIARAIAALSEYGAVSWVEC